MNSTRPNTKRRVGATVVVTVLVCLAWALTVSRAIPYRDGDRGVFASMAERIVAGDRLYVDVWDNKEPLFYLTLALGRLVSPYMDVVLELAWIAIGALAAYAIARSHGIPWRMAVLLGWAATPLILTGGAYSAGFTHLPGTALLLASYALLIRGRLMLTGALLPVIGAFKILALPLALAILAVAVLGRRDARWSRYVIGASAATAVLAAILAVRGELGGFLTLVRTNMTYSQADLADAYRVPIWSHLEPVLQGSTVATIALITLILALTWRSSTGATRGLWWTTLATLVAAAVVVAITGLWPHHAQLFFFSAVLAAVLLMSTVPDLRGVSISAVVALLAVTVVLSGAPSLRDSADSLLSAPTRWRDLDRTAMASEALLAVARPGDSYARLGKNTDDSHAQGLRDLRLVCYQFLQYPYDPPANLSRIPECLPSADFVLVDPTFALEEGRPIWNTLVTESEQRLALNFSCSDYPWGRLCARNGAQ